MQIIYGLQNIKKIKNSIVTQGTFDGVHTGHLKILRSIVLLAKEKKCKSVMLTFHPHPRQVLSKEANEIKLLTTFEEKKLLLQQTGLDYLLVIPFDKKFSELTAEEFIKEILVDKIGVNTLVVGYDHRFGKNREGKFEDLTHFSEKYKFNVKEIAAYDIAEATVSSTKIRKSLLQGDIQTANTYLGRKYFLSGTVVEGRKLGRTIGFPTANIKVEDEDKLIPANGVYVVYVKYKNIAYGGMMNIGNRPSVKGASWSIEVNIFDFSRNIYGEKLVIFFIDKLRDETKFDSIDELKSQLKVDFINARKILEKNSIGQKKK